MGKYRLRQGDGLFPCRPDEVEITTQDVEGSAVASQGQADRGVGCYVVDAALKAEGIAREVVNRIQNMRKESGLNVSDRTDVDVNSSEEVKLAIEANIDYICSETLTQKLSFFGKHGR